MTGRVGTEQKGSKESAYLVKWKGIVWRVFPCEEGDQSEFSKGSIGFNMDSMTAPSHSNHLQIQFQGI